MRFAISLGDFDCAASSNTRRSCLKDQPPFSFRAIYDFPAFAFSPSSTSRRSVSQPEAAGKRDFPRRQFPELVEILRRQFDNGGSAE
jgi:hypothetical protein